MDQGLVTVRNAIAQGLNGARSGMQAESRGTTKASKNEYKLHRGFGLDRCLMKFRTG